MMINKIKGLLVNFVKEKARENQSTNERKEFTQPETKIVARVVKEEERIEKVEFPKIDLSYKFPLEQDDIIELRSGKKYKVCKRSISGAINQTSVTLSWINKPEMLTQKDRVEQIHFGSLREMNYYFQKEIQSIINIKKSYKTKAERTLSISECHELALEENQKRDKVKHFFDTLHEKKINS